MNTLDYICPWCELVVTGVPLVDWVSIGYDRYHRDCINAYYEKNKMDHNAWRENYKICEMLPGVF